MKNYKGILGILIFGMLLTSCDTMLPSTSTDANDILETQESTQNISTGYIIIPDGDEFVSLYDDADISIVKDRIYSTSPVTVYNIESDVAKISYNGKDGYVELIYLSFAKPENTTTTLEIQTEIETSTQLETVAETEKETQLQTQAVISQNIEQNLNITFLVDTDGIKVAEPKCYPDYMPKNSGTSAWCSATSVYIYSEPSTSSYKREANMLYNGDSCTILGSIGSWYYISTDDGSNGLLHGYVKQQYITIGNSPVAEKSAYASYCRVNVDSANIRSTPDKTIDSNVIGTVYRGEEFTILDYINNYWYEISYNGSIAYISHKMVEVW